MERKLGEITRHSILALGALVATSALTQAQNGYKAFGPIGEFGFPEWYQDHQDLALGHCIDQNDPLCNIPAADFLTGPLVVGPNPAANNFFGESFYYQANSLMTVEGRGDAELIIAVEGVFGNPTEAIIDGDQTVFSRLRIRLNGDGFETGFYRIFTPYGTYGFDGVATTGRIVNNTVDCLHVFLDPAEPPFTTLICGSAPDGPNANYFTTPLGVLDDGTAAPEFAPNGPNFLVWDADAPEGYIGDPLIPHTVTGAVAPNQNIFRVEFSAADGEPVEWSQETDLFNVMGKIADATAPPPPPPPAGLALGAPDPGMAGAVNSYAVTGATGGGRVGLLMSPTTGAMTLNIGPCPAGIAIGLSRPRVLGLALADAGGAASFSIRVPATVAGRSFSVQAVDVSSCTASNVDTSTY